MASKRKNVTPPAAKEIVSADRIQASIRSRFNPIRNLTPDLLAQNLDSFKVGFIKQAVLLWDDIEQRDDTLSSVIPKRKKAPGRNGWEILTVETEDDAEAAEAQKHKEVLENFWNNITVTSALDQNERGELSLLCRQMMDSIGKKYAVHEIVWKPSPDGLSAEFRFVPLWFFENTTGKLRFITSEGSIMGVDMEDGCWLITVGDGLMFACSIAYIYKNLSLKDWVIYNERHGMPGIHGKTSALKDTAEWNDLAEAIANFASDWSVLTNQGASLDKIDMATQGQLPYPPLVDRMSRAMAAIWRGADLSTISSGQGTGASLQGDEMTLLEQDDAALISETLSRQIDCRVVEYNFGEGVKPLAYIKIKTSIRQDIAQDIKIDQFLIDNDAPLGVKNTLERYGRSMPDEADALLSQPQSMPQPGLNPPSDRIANGRPVPHTGRPNLGNSTSSANPARTDSALVSSGTVAVARAIADDLQPVCSRLETIMQVEDLQLRNVALKKLQSDLPALLKKINTNPASVKVLEDTLAAAMVNGIEESSKGTEAQGIKLKNSFDPEQPRDEQGRWSEQGMAAQAATAEAESKNDVASHRHAADLHDIAAKDYHAKAKAAWEANDIAGGNKFAALAVDHMTSTARHISSATRLTKKETSKMLRTISRQERHE